MRYVFFFTVNAADTDYIVLKRNYFHVKYVIDYLGKNITNAKNINLTELNNKITIGLKIHQNSLNVN